MDVLLPDSVPGREEFEGELPPLPVPVCEGCEDTPPSSAMPQQPHSRSPEHCRRPPFQAAFWVGRGNLPLPVDSPGLEHVPDWNLRRSSALSSWSRGHWWLRRLHKDNLLREYVWRFHRLPGPCLYCHRRLPGPHLYRRCWPPGPHWALHPDSPP
ncbi:hypothetical protein AMECASPLE_012683 [Ameca splendens]|uniref:Uncharacterized protein n=1 Tax=Ameca splendens TaxID=208324 RepID=A0ABV0Y1J5_9TELE